MENKILNRTKFIPIGTIINYDGVLLKVVETQHNSSSCSKCYFSDWERRKRGLGKFSCYLHKIACTKYLRRDGKHVIFIENHK